MLVGAAALRLVLLNNWILEIQQAIQNFIIVTLPLMFNQSTIDIVLVEERYRRMSNQELIDLAQKESAALSPDAVNALYKEFLVRKMDTTVIAELRAKRFQETRTQQQKETDAAIDRFWDYMLEAHKHRLSEDEIRTTLSTYGISHEFMDAFVGALREEAAKRADACEAQVILGVIISLVGVFMTLFLLGNGNKFSFIAPLLVVSGIIRIVQAIARSNKYRKIKEACSAFTE